jgi:CheY-like chemotaxis protein
MRRSLERFGYTVLEAPDGQTALAIAARHRAGIHLLITDVVLPGIGGRQLATQLRELRPDTLVVYMSGYADDVVLRRGELERWASFLQKPFTPEALARHIRQRFDVEGLKP